MAVSITARLAAENGWTFIKNDHPSLLPDAIAMAEWYQPSVVFCEDIDTCSPENRNEQVNDLLNTIDGIEKDREVMVVFTTNHVDQIGPALLRPGRIDAVINFDPPDGPTAGRLIRHYGKDLISPKTSTEQAGSILAGAPASMIREVVERAKLNAISNSRRIDHLTEDDLTYAAKSLSQHLSLCIPSQRISPTPISAKTAEEFGVGLGEGLKKSLLLHQDPIHVE